MDTNDDTKLNQDNAQGEANGMPISYSLETLPISLETEMKRSYLEYAMSVIVGRALPAVVCSACCKMQHCQHTVFRAFPQTVSPRRTNLCVFNGKSSQY